ncbi:hypothetical protein SUGI_1125250 [Cryptomeria japonica]|nr:hypothetical protein SUGI_1125250 [Cryptomeria japonica]
MVEYDCQPTTGTYAVLVAGLCKVGRLYEADKLVQSMRERGLVPNGSINASLAMGYCQEGKSARALKILESMVKNGFELSLSICNAVLTGLYREGNKTKADIFFDDVIISSFSSDEITWTVLIDGLLKEGAIDVCLKLLERMEERGSEPSVQTYSLLTRELFKQDKTMEAKALVDKMMEKGFVMEEALPC